MSDQNQLPDMEPEQLAELNALESMAAVQDAQTAEGQPAQQEPEPVALAAEISGVLSMVVGVVAPMFPSLKLIYTPEAIDRVGKTLEPVCVKHGWLAGGIGGEYAEELLALCIVGPLVFATYKGIQGDIAESKPAKQIENVPAMPLGQMVGPSPDGDESRLTVSMGEVKPHENN